MLIFDGVIMRQKFPQNEYIMHKKCQSEPTQKSGYQAAQQIVPVSYDILFLLLS